MLRDTNITVISDEIYLQSDLRRRAARLFAELDGMLERTIVRTASQILCDDRLAPRQAMGPKELCTSANPSVRHHVRATTAQFAGIEAIRPARTISNACARSMTSAAVGSLGELRSMGLTCFEPQGAFAMRSLPSPRPASSEVHSANVCFMSSRSPLYLGSVRQKRRWACSHLLFLFHEPSARGLLPHAEIPAVL